MKRYYTYILAMLGIALLIISLSACNKISDSPTMNHISPSPTPIINPPVPDNDKKNALKYSNNKRSDSAPSNESSTGFELTVRDVTIYIGEDKDSVIKKLGPPSRIDETEYDFNYYVYNNDYCRLVFVAIADDKVVGLYTDSLGFSYNGICYGSGIDDVNKSLGSSFSLNSVLTKEYEDYTINVLVDKLVSHKVVGIYILAKSVKPDKYTETVKKNIELMVYDLTNSIRARNQEQVLSWSSSAALSARKHSLDMAENNYFNHNTPLGRKPSDRMRAEGIYYSTCGENIIAGYGTAILSSHAWFNSSGHRNNMLNPKFRYLGIGFTYRAESTYQTYITQDYYR